MIIVGTKYHYAMSKHIGRIIVLFDFAYGRVKAILRNNTVAVLNRSINKSYTVTNVVRSRNA